MAKTDTTPDDTPAETAKPTRAEALAAAEVANAARAVEGHTAPKHIDDITLTGE